MNSHQLQVSYQVEQDRLLVRLNTHSGEELRLWLTRRMICRLFPHMVQASALPGAALPQLASHDGADDRALTQFRKQEVLQQADFQTPFDNGAAVLPIGSEPLLATTVHITPQDSGAMRLAFEENAPGTPANRRIEVMLEPALLHGFMHLLEQALKAAEWGIMLAPGQETPEATVVDALAAAEPPKYLN